MSEIILETESLTKEFAGFVAVNGVNLRVARGTIHALIGHNGAGKTTCFNLLTKFFRPTRGRIVYQGRRPWYTMRPRVGRKNLVSRLKQVVLPAPLGPISAWMVPRATRRLTPLTATKPANSLVRLSVSR